VKRKTQWQAKISLFLMQFRSEITNLRCFIISFFFFFCLFYYGLRILNIGIHYIYLKIMLQEV
jgi:hypothetical protein